MTVYLLSYGENAGGSKNSIFNYIPFEAFKTAEDREERIKYLRQSVGKENYNEEDEDLYLGDELDFLKIDLEEFEPSEISSLHPNRDRCEYYDKRRTEWVWKEED